MIAGFREKPIFQRADSSTALLALLWRIALVGCALALAGCASIGRIGYDNLPTIALWRIDSYLSLSSPQRAQASRHLEDLHAWHRRTQLDAEAEFLIRIRQRVASGGVTEADARQWRAQVLEVLQPIPEQAAPAIAEVAATLEASQLARMKAEFARDNAKMRREWMPTDRDERIEVRAKRYIERAEFLLGDLSAAQKQTARRLAAEAPPSEDQWFAQRLERQQDLIAVLERIRTERPSQSQATQWVLDHLNRFVQVRDGPERAGVESSLAAGDAMAVTLLSQATPKQKQHLLNRLQSWIDLLYSLKPKQTAGLN